jgi:uncharacterized protein YecE (DUF72 family)
MERYFILIKWLDDKWFNFYASQFNTVELNTFYRFHQLKNCLAGKEKKSPG